MYVLVLVVVVVVRAGHNKILPGDGHAGARAALPPSADAVAGERPVGPAPGVAMNQASAFGAKAIFLTRQVARSGSPATFTFKDSIRVSNFS